MSKYNFTKEIEKLIDPINVGTLHFMQTFNDLLPKKIQNKIMKASSKKTPQMGFVVDPYSFFLFYEIKDLEKANGLIPDGFKLIKTKIFETDEPKYYTVFGCFNARTSAFLGMRTEFYIIAEDTKTNLLSWIIIDYDTNTISHDKKNGLVGPNLTNSFSTINYDGTLFVQSIRKDNSRSLKFESDITKGKTKKLDQRLWLEGNLSIGYGKTFSGTDEDIFSLKFNPKEVEQALNIPLDALKLETNSWYQDLIKETPSELVCFPFAQHFLSDSPGYSSKLKTKADLEKEISSVDFSKISVFSTKPFKLMLIFSGVFSFLLTITLIILLILK